MVSDPICNYFVDYVFIYKFLFNKSLTVYVNIPSLALEQTEREVDIVILFPVHLQLLLFAFHSYFIYVLKCYCCDVFDLFL